jgi:hypothetical protein
MATVCDSSRSCVTLFGAMSVAHSRPPGDSLARLASRIAVELANYFVLQFGNDPIGVCSHDLVIGQDA